VHEFGGIRCGPKVLQENHPYGPAVFLERILIFSQLLRNYGKTTFSGAA